MGAVLAAERAQSWSGEEQKRSADAALSD